MGKCRDVYRKYLQEHPHTAVGFDHFAHIYNVRGEVDKEICRTIVSSDVAAQQIGVISALDCVEAIEQEDEK